MEMLTAVLETIVSQLQKPTLSFLIGGMLLAALGSRFEIPQPIYKFIVVLLLLKVGLGAGMSIAEADLLSLAAPALAAILAGVLIVLAGGYGLAKRFGVGPMDGYATAGLFGAVSASTLAAGMAVLEGDGIYYEGFIGALYPFMDIAALVTAIVLAKTAEQRATATQLSSDGTMTMSIGGGPGANGKTGAFESAAERNSMIRQILVDTAQSPAISALLLGLAIGIFAEPQAVYASFYEPLFRGLLSILMLIMGMEAWARLSELRKVAHVYLLYGLTAPFFHGAIGLGLGLIAHELTGFSAGGIALLAVMAASSSDISGPPTLRGALPEANPSAYVGASTGLGTPIAILTIPLWIGLAQWAVG